MEQLHNEWPIKNGAEKEVEFETTDDVGRYVPGAWRRLRLPRPGSSWTTRESWRIGRVTRSLAKKTIRNRRDPLRDRSMDGAEDGDDDTDHSFRPRPHRTRTHSHTLTLAAPHRRHAQRINCKLSHSFRFRPSPVQTLFLLSRLPLSLSVSSSSRRSVCLPTTGAVNCKQRRRRRCRRWLPSRSLSGLSVGESATAVQRRSRCSVRASC